MVPIYTFAPLLTCPPISCIQIAFNSEWGIKKFFGSIKDKETERILKLLAVCGVEKNKEDAIENLRKGIIENESPEDMKENAQFLTQKLASGEFLYFNVNGDCSLPQEIYDMKFQATINHSKNITHLGYIIDSIKHRKNILCEKPLVPVLDERGNPTDKYLKSLKEITATADGLTLMDAEHYSYKKASVIFYKNLGDILEDEDGKRRKIKSIEGSLVEIDNPYKWRTQAVLSKENQTGLLGDTMVHLLSFISNLRGKAIPINRKYAKFEDEKVKYEVDTYDYVDYKIENLDRDFFAGDSVASLEIAKFADRAGRTEKKEVKFTLDDNSEIILDLKGGSVKKTKNGKTKDYAEGMIVSSNEYNSILSHFCNCIQTRQKPLTNFDNSINTLETICQDYKIGREIGFYNN